jgi:hypothetical protein
MAIWLRGSAAMNTSQIAGLRDFPDRDEWTFVESIALMSGFMIR